MTTALSSPQDEIELQNSDPVPPADSQCNVCQKPAAFMCSSCGLNGPRYCSTECQSQGWREGHYRLCQGNAQTRANAASRARNNTPEPAAAAAAGSIPMVELRNNDTSAEEDEQQEFADELRFYIKQIYLVIQPVVICIILSIFWVKVAFSGTSDYTPVRPSYSIGTSPTTTSGGSDSSSSSAISSLTTALVIVGQIILVTLVIVFLFRRGWIKVGANNLWLENWWSFPICLTPWLDIDWIFHDSGRRTTGIYELPAYLELDRGILYTSGLSNNDIRTMEFCSCRINIGVLEVATVVAASLFDYYELVNGVFIDWLGAVDNVDVTGSIGYMGFNCCPMSFWTVTTAD
ncbi:hypothetical protein NQZ79_g6769 [Umbelopsis isabellina]|nr:hypothetical protein NQZ79_g6769 [Umbelopsis isabellina]